MILSFSLSIAGGEVYEIGDVNKLFPLWSFKSFILNIGSILALKEGCVFLFSIFIFCLFFLI